MVNRTIKSIMCKLWIHLFLSWRLYYCKADSSVDCNYCSKEAPKSGLCYYFTEMKNTFDFKLDKCYNAVADCEKPIKAACAAKCPVNNINGCDMSCCFHELDDQRELSSSTCLSTGCVEFLYCCLWSEWDFYKSTVECGEVNTKQENIWADLGGCMSNCTGWNYLSYIPDDGTCSCYDVCAEASQEKTWSFTLIQNFPTPINDSLNWTCVEDSCYTVGVKSTTFDGAQEFCDLYNATLVSIISDYENDIVFSLCPNTCCWIGLVHHLVRGWEWEDSTLEWKNWAENQPSGEGRDYVIMNCVIQDFCNKTNGKWFSTVNNNYDIIYPVCERPLNRTNGTAHTKMILVLFTSLGGTSLLVAYLLHHLCKVGRKTSFEDLSSRLICFDVPIMESLPSELISLNQFTMEDFSMKKLIGEGEFSKAVQFLRIADKKMLVGKIFTNTLISDEDFIREAKLHHQSTNYSNFIVPVFGVITEPKVLLLEFLKNGALDEALEQDFESFDSDEKSSYPIMKRLSFALDMVKAVNQLHILNIVHRDLAMRNLLLSDDASYCLLSDFSLASVIGDGPGAERSSRPIVSKMSAPEAFSPAARISMKLDVWGCAMTISEIVNKRSMTHLRKSEGSNNFFRRVPNSKAYRPTRLFCDEGCSSSFARNGELWVLLLRCLQRDPDQRPHIWEIKQQLDPIVKSPNFNRNDSEYVLASVSSSNLSHELLR